MVFAEYGDERLFIDRKGSCETEPSSSQEVREEMDSDQDDMWQMSSTATILRRKGFLRVIRNVIFWRGVSVLQKEEPLATDGSSCPAIRSLFYVRCSVTLQKPWRETASPDTETEPPGVVVLEATAQSILPLRLFSAFISVSVGF